MLSYALAIAVALSSLVLFLTAFLMSDIHRRDDFLWSGVGLFYALVLWFCARNITGAILLGQTAATILLVSYSWQTLKLRKAVANPTRAPEIDNFSVLQTINSLLKRNKPQPVIVEPAVVSPPAKITEEKITIPDTTTEDKPEATQLQKSGNSISSNKQNKPGKPGMFGKMFGNKQKTTITNTKLEDILEEEETASTFENATSEIPTAVKKEVERAVGENPQDTISEILPEVQSEVQPKKSAQATKSQQKDQLSDIAINQPEVTPVKPPIEVQNSDVQNDPITLDIKTEQDNIPPLAESMLDIKQADSSARDEPKESVSESTAKPDSSSTSASVPARTTKEVSELQPEKKASSLDDLETVEVAEVLDARSGNTSMDQESDQSNIIEVTTTEIDITDNTPKVKRVDRRADQDEIDQDMAPDSDRAEE